MENCFVFVPSYYWRIYGAVWRCVYFFRTVGFFKTLWTSSSRAQSYNPYQFSMNLFSNLFLPPEAFECWASSGALFSTATPIKVSLLLRRINEKSFPIKILPHRSCGRAFGKYLAAPAIPSLMYPELCLCTVRYRCVEHDFPAASVTGPRSAPFLQALSQALWYSSSNRLPEAKKKEKEFSN